MSSLPLSYDDVPPQGFSDDVSMATSHRSWPGGSHSASTHNQVFKPLARYRGHLVAVRRINKPFVYLTEDIIHELNQVRLQATQLDICIMSNAQDTWVTGCAKFHSVTFINFS